ncbi:MAG: hypothetical protein J5873_02135 [Bacteroidales bacterium]|nr:hypothetical protein [Bacteroidales bacterium]
MKFDKVEKLVKEYKELLAETAYSKEYTYYEQVYNITAFEGSTLTESEVVDLLKYGETPKKKPEKCIRQVKDAYTTLQYILQMTKKKKALSVDILHEIGARVMASTGGVCKGDLENYDSSKGDFRKGVVKNASRLFPDYKRLPVMMDQFCADLQKQIKQAENMEERSVLTYNALYTMLNVYPFGEGNVSSAFFVYNYLQALCDLPMSFLYKVDGVRFLAIFDQARTQGNLHPYHVFCFKQYIKFLEEEIAEMQK